MSILNPCEPFEFHRGSTVRGSSLEDNARMSLMAGRDDIFARVREILTEVLGVDEGDVTLEANLITDPGAEPVALLPGGRVRRQGLELVTRYLRPGINRGANRASQVPGEPRLSVCTCSHPTPAGLLAPDHCSAVQQRGHLRQCLRPTNNVNLVLAVPRITRTSPSAHDRSRPRRKNDRYGLVQFNSSPRPDAWKLMEM